MNIQERIAALPKMPPAIPAEAAGYSKAMSSRLALALDVLREMAQDCTACHGTNRWWSYEGKYTECPRCADARAVLEAQAQRITELERESALSQNLAVELHNVQKRLAEAEALLLEQMPERSMWHHIEAGSWRARVRAFLAKAQP